jgi:hypothetical protein
MRRRRGPAGRAREDFGCHPRRRCSEEFAVPELPTESGGQPESGAGRLGGSWFPRHEPVRLESNRTNALHFPLRFVVPPRHCTSMYLFCYKSQLSCPDCLGGRSQPMASAVEGDVISDDRNPAGLPSDWKKTRHSEREEVVRIQFAGLAGRCFVITSSEFLLGMLTFT